LFCDHGKFLPSEDIRTPYNKLNSILRAFKWERDFENVHFSIFKERDYFSFKVIEDEQNVLKELETSTASESTLQKMVILKAAKRGFKSNQLDTELKNIEFARKSLNRLNGQPIEFEMVTLTKFKDFLNKEKVLNETSLTHKRLGCENIRYHCNSIPILRKRVRIKEKFKRLSYADALDCKLNNPTLYNNIIKKTKDSTPLPHNQLSIKIQHAICSLISHQNVSLRKLELFFKLNGFNLGKSTIQRWNKKYVSSQDFLNEKPTQIPDLKTKISSLLVTEFDFDVPDTHAIYIIKRFLLNKKSMLSLKNSNILYSFKENLLSE